MPTILVGTWNDGLLALTDDTIREERPGESVVALARHASGDALAVVGGKSLCRRHADGHWSTIARSETELACCVAAGAAIYAGSSDAQVMRACEDGSFERLAGFDHVAGRDRWYAGTALIDGRLLGPPLGVRSMTATCDHAVVLANVHVGGIPRSGDHGATWQPTIDINSDVHQVCAHPTRPEIVVAAAGIGLGISRDGGLTWKVQHEGLHAPHCSAVACVGDDILVSASTDPFAPQGAIYRRPIDGDVPIRPVGGGLPRWLDGKADTGNIAVRGRVVALADMAGNLYVSQDAGSTWARRADGLPAPSSLFIY